MTFNRGDVLIGGEFSYAEHIEPLAGVYQQHVRWEDDIGRDMVVNGQTFDQRGNAYAALGAPGHSDYEPHDIVWMPNDSGLLVIIAVGTDVQLWKYNLDGDTVLQKWIGLSKDASWVPQDDNKRLKVDIACDSTSVYYTDQGLSVFHYDLNTSTQKANWDTLPASSNYRYNAFKLIQKTNPQQIVAAMTTSGNGPQRAVCLDGNKTKHWTDEVNPPTPGLYHVYKRELATTSTGEMVLSHVVSLSPSDDNDKIWSLACYVNLCGARVPQVTLVGAT